jgi:hypothetical protein
LVGEWDGAGGKFGYPSCCHVRFEGILLLKQRSTFGVVVETDELHRFLARVRQIVPPVLELPVTIFLFHIISIGTTTIIQYSDTNVIT